MARALEVACCHIDQLGNQVKLLQDYPIVSLSAFTLILSLTSVTRSKPSANSPARSEPYNGVSLSIYALLNSASL